MSFEPKEKSYQESFEPMPMANEPPPAPEPKTYSGDSDGLREASRDLNDTREQAPIIERGYVSNAGEDRGKPRPANETRTLKQSAADLANMRREEQELTDLMASQEFASEVDADRIAAMAEQQAQVQPDLTPQPEVQQASSPAPNGVSPKIQAALADPEIRDAINAQIQQSEVARQAYSAAAEQ